MGTDQIALFPLANVVLFPKAMTPLHIFEARYRQMAEAALEGNRMIGMVAVPPEHSGSMGGDPPVYPVGCAGFIADHERLADGRYHIVLRGTHRFRIREELPPAGERLYRVAETELLLDPDGDPHQSNDIRGRVVELLKNVMELSSEESFDEDPLSELDSEAFTNTICQSLQLPAPEKQGLLEADGLIARLERLEALLSFHLTLMRRAGTAGSDTVH